MKKLKLYLFENEISNKELAEILQISEANVSHKLNGRNKFSVSELNIIRKHFKLSDENFRKLFFPD